jgi:hypothetical protein
MEEPLAERRTIAGALAGLTSSDEPATAADGIIAALMTLPAALGAALTAFDGTNQASIMSMAGPEAVPVRAGGRLPPEIGDYLREHAPGGPWDEDQEDSRCRRRQLQPYRGTAAGLREDQHRVDPRNQCRSVASGAGRRVHHFARASNGASSPRESRPRPNWPPCGPRHAVRPGLPPGLARGRCELEGERYLDRGRPSSATGWSDSDGTTAGRGRLMRDRARPTRLPLRHNR